MDFQLYHLVYVDESGCHKRIGFRQTGWSPCGRAPIQISQFHCGQQYQILPAYAQDGIVLLRIFHSSTDAAMFRDFIVQLLRTVEDGLSPNLFWSWTMHHSTALSKLC